MSDTLVLKNVSKIFGTDKPFEVLTDISLKISEGEFVSIVGPSGCGKSVLLYLIADFIRPSAGEILVEGRAISRPDTDRMMVFQDYALLPWKNVYENVVFALEKSGLSNKGKEERATKYIKMVGLEEFKDWHVHKLSGGMKQRVSTARAMVVDSKILLMDEPFAALDSQRRRFLRKNLLDVWGKTKRTVLFVTHSISEALYLSDKVYVMTRRPASIKKEYNVDLPRPRDPSNPRYIDLRLSIEQDLFQEFDRESGGSEGDLLIGSETMRKIYE